MDVVLAQKQKGIGLNHWGVRTAPSFLSVRVFVFPQSVKLNVKRRASNWCGILVRASLEKRGTEWRMAQPGKRYFVTHFSSFRTLHCKGVSCKNGLRTCSREDFSWKAASTTTLWERDRFNPEITIIVWLIFHIQICHINTAYRPVN